MAETTDYTVALSEALMARKDWLEKTALVDMKEQLRIYQTSFASLYNIFLKKKLVDEDPYKHETKIGELSVPDTGPFTEAKHLEQISIRLSNFDSQIDFLVNFYQFGVDFLNLERIKKILGLVRYIDWGSLTPDSQYPNTKAVAEITTQSKVGLDPIALSIVGEALTKLPKSTVAVIGILKDLSNYHKENYKLSVRNAVTKSMQPAEAKADNIKKKIASAMPGTPFYHEFIDELIREDFSSQGPTLKEAVLKSLAVASEKPKAVKPQVSYKAILVDGLRTIGSAAPTFAEIMGKIDENETTLANQKRSVWAKIKKALQQMMHSEPDEQIFDIEYMDPVKGVRVKQQVNYHQFRTDMDKRIRTLSAMGINGSASARFEAMQEEQIVTLLERTIRDVQTVHRTLTALDEFFVSEAPKEMRDRIKRVRPELATIKNAFIRANQLRHDYSAQKEEQEQMKRLGINVDG